MAFLAHHDYFHFWLKSAFKIHYEQAVSLKKKVSDQVSLSIPKFKKLQPMWIHTIIIICAPIHYLGESL